jgi:hypothetical protein
MTTIDRILIDIEKSLKYVDIDFSEDSWRDNLPARPGWYFIETNTPPSEFLEVGPPKGERHYNIRKKAEESLYLNKLVGACILPSKNPFYFVYSGEAKDLKARAREHQSGHSKTGCLALENYKILHRYQWRFHYAICLFGQNYKESKILRIFGEQLWRCKHGWPLLCGK